jgi:hypothetical protein
VLPRRVYWRRRPAHTDHQCRAEVRIRAIYEEDADMPLRKSHENPAVQTLYEEFLGRPLGEKSHKLTAYTLSTPGEILTTTSPTLSHFPVNPPTCLGGFLLRCPVPAFTSLPQIFRRIPLAKYKNSTSARHYRQNLLVQLGTRHEIENLLTAARSGSGR